MKFSSFAQTDVGLARPENEDSFLCSDELHLYAVADGIGGLPAGAEASQMTIAVLEQCLRDHKGIESLDYQGMIEIINEQVLRLGRALSPKYGIGSTLTFAHLVGVKLHIGHVGDSTAFRWRAKKLEQLSTDHTIESEMKEREARGESRHLLMENRNALTRCIGQPPPILGHISAHTILPHDRYLLCSDGITRFVAVDEIDDILQQSSTPAMATSILINRANARGGLDNSTAVVLFFD